VTVIRFPIAPCQWRPYEKCMDESGSTTLSAKGSGTRERPNLNVLPVDSKAVEYKRGTAAHLHRKREVCV